MMLMCPEHSGFCFLFFFIMYCNIFICHFKNPYFFLLFKHMCQGMDACVLVAMQNMSQDTPMYCVAIVLIMSHA